MLQLLKYAVCLGLLASAMDDQWSKSNETCHGVLQTGEMLFGHTKSSSPCAELYKSGLLEYISITPSAIFKYTGNPNDAWNSTHATYYDSFSDVIGPYDYVDEKSLRLMTSKKWSGAGVSGELAASVYDARSDLTLRYNHFVMNSNRTVTKPVCILEGGCARDIDPIALQMGHKKYSYLSSSQYDLFSNPRTTMTGVIEVIQVNGPAQVHVMSCDDSCTDGRQLKGYSEKTTTMNTKASAIAIQFEKIEHIFNFPRYYNYGKISSGAAIQDGSGKLHISVLGPHECDRCAGKLRCYCVVYGTERVHNRNTELDVGQQFYHLMDPSISQEEGRRLDEGTCCSTTTMGFDDMDGSNDSDASNADMLTLFTITYIVSAQV